MLDKTLQPDSPKQPGLADAWTDLMQTVELVTPEARKNNNTETLELLRKKLPEDVRELIDAEINTLGQIIASTTDGDEALAEKAGDKLKLLKSTPVEYFTREGKEKWQRVIGELEAARRKIKEEMKLAAEARARVEAEARLRAEQEALVRIRAEEEARLAAEETSRRMAQEEKLRTETARIKAETERQEQAERVAARRARLQVGEEARARAEEEARLAATRRAKVEKLEPIKGEPTLEDLEELIARTKRELEELDK